MSLPEFERGHTYTFTCKYYNAAGQLYDPTTVPTGDATAKVYRRDELIASLTTDRIGTGDYEAKWSVPTTATLEEYYCEWGWNEGDSLAGRYKFRIKHTGIDQ